MAKTDGPLLSQCAHGSIAGVITYQGRGKTNQVHIKKTPPDRKTTQQTTRRAIVTTAANEYAKESAAEKTDFATEATKRKILSGYNLYQKIFLLHYADWHRLSGAKFKETKFGGPKSALDKI